MLYKVLTSHIYNLHSATVETEVCTISEECFAVPPGYRRIHRGRGMVDEEEELLQLAIRQSLMEQAGGGMEVVPAPDEVGDGSV